jgi:hypothetical protein
MEVPDILGLGIGLLGIKYGIINKVFMARLNLFNEFLHIIPLLICMALLIRAAKALFALYSTKKNPDYPLTRKDSLKYLTKDPKDIAKFYLTPFAMWKIIFETHADKELNASAKKVRYLFFLLLVVTIFWFLLPS